MAIIDPLGDMLTRIRNAQLRRKSRVSTPGSKLRARFSPEGGVSLTPHLTGTDGFYVVAMQRGSGEPA